MIDLTKLKPGECGFVVEIQGGEGFTSRIQSMGIRPGKRITKVSSHFWGGPQTIKIDNMKVAIGFGMAKKIFIEREKNGKDSISR